MNKYLFLFSFVIISCGEGPYGYPHFTEFTTFCRNDYECQPWESCNLSRKQCYRDPSWTMPPGEETLPCGCWSYTAHSQRQENPYCYSYYDIPVNDGCDFWCTCEYLNDGLHDACGVYDSFYRAYKKVCK